MHLVKCRTVRVEIHETRLLLRIQLQGPATGKNGIVYFDLLRSLSLLPFQKPYLPCQCLTQGQNWSHRCPVCFQSQHLVEESRKAECQESCLIHIGQCFISAKISNLILLSKGYLKSQENLKLICTISSQKMCSVQEQSPSIQIPLRVTAEFPSSKALEM